MDQLLFQRGALMSQFFILAHQVLNMLRHQGYLREGNLDLGLQLVAHTMRQIETVLHP